MREFSQFERNIIKNHLLKGARLPGMLSEEFRKSARLLIHYLKDGAIKLEYRSDGYSRELATEEIVNIVELLGFLEKNGLIRKYPPSATIQAFNDEAEISLGESEGSATEEFLLHQGSSHIPKFIKQTQDYEFKATEPLRTLAEHNFKSEEDRRHEETMRNARTSNRIAIFVALTTLVVTAVLGYIQYESSYDDLRDKLSVVIAEQEKLKNELERNKGDLKNLRKEFGGFKIEFEKSKIPTKKEAR